MNLEATVSNDKTYSLITTTSAITALALILFGCSATDSGSGSAGAANGGAGASAAGASGTPAAGGAPATGGSGAPSVAGSGTTGGSGAPSTGPAQHVAVPFVVEPTGTTALGFAPSGYMPDGDNGVTSSPMTAQDPNSTCDGSAPTGAQGICRTFTLTKFSSIDWSGVYYQFPDANWGTQQGLGIAAGATKVRFQAKGKAGGETITAWMGGIGWKDGVKNSTMQYSDAFSINPPPSFTLTTSWQTFEIPIPTGTDYSSGVLGGFAWGMAKPTGFDGSKPVVFYITDIVWE